MGDTPGVQKRLRSDRAKTRRYDVTTEPVPDRPFYKEDFKRTFAEGISIAEELSEKLERLQISRPDTKHSELLSKALMAKRFHVKDALEIGFMGDSGSGKSSTVNSLMDETDVAFKGNLGTAATQYLTEYRQSGPQHSTKFHIEVEYMSTTEVHDYTKELYWTCRKFYLLDAQETVDDGVYHKCEMDKDNAWKILCSIFDSQAKTSILTEELLRDQSEIQSEQMLLQFMETLEWPEGLQENGIFTATADDMAAFKSQRRKIRKFKLQELVKVMRVYLNSHILLQGIVLKDLAGLKDTNLARVRATEKCVASCDYVFIVADIGRAITNSSLQQSIDFMREIRFNDRRNTAQPEDPRLPFAVVLTRSEDITVETAREEYGEEGLNILDQEYVQQLEDAIMQAEEDGDEKTLHERESDLGWHCIDVRSMLVRGLLYASYDEKHPSAPSLKIHCISNKTYGEAAKANDEDMVKNSGIPVLRKFCYSKAAQAQLGIATHYLRTTLSGLLASCENWAESRLVERNSLDVFQENSGKIMYMLKELKADTKRTFEESQLRIKSIIDDQLLQYFHARGAYWVRRAIEKVEEYGKWRYSQWKAFLVKEGNHMTPKIPKTNWNRDFQWLMAQELNEGWTMLEEETRDTMQALFEAIQLRMNGLTEAISDAGLPKQLVIISGAKLADIKFHVDRVNGKLSRQVGLIRTNASKAHANSYMVKAMTPIYRVAQLEQGKGAFKRQVEKVKARISNGEVFPSIRQSIEEELKPTIDTNFKVLEDHVVAAFAGIQDEISTALDNSKPGHDDFYEEMQEAKKKLGRQLSPLKNRFAAMCRAIADVDTIARA